MKLGSWTCEADFGADSASLQGARGRLHEDEVRPQRRFGSVAPGGELGVFFESRFHNVFKGVDSSPPQSKN